VSLDDKVATWLPEIPYTDRVTLGQLAQMTSGYVDYVSTPELTDAQYANPFRSVTPEELIAISTKHPLLYEPGTNWNYSHTNYVILGLALEKITGESMSALMQQTVLGPLGLDNTTDPGNGGDHRARVALLHLGAPAGPQDSRRHTLLRGIDLLEPVVDHHPRRHPDHRHP
jgi:CubicO group peptidase (beta-lactamase class C family)